MENKLYSLSNQRQVFEKNLKEVEGQLDGYLKDEANF